jgi:drug/metabolite transporter (DMT)-like permease
VLWGSLSYAIDFHGIQLSTPATSAFIGHAQFLLVAVLAAVFLGERFEWLVWGGLIALLVGLSQGMNYEAIQLGPGALWSGASTGIYATGFVLAKYLLRELSALTVMTAKMTIGSVMLLSYVAVTGSLGSVAHLNTTQWSFVLATGAILAAFTATAVLALRYASATAATAIPAAVAPIITTALTLIATQRIALAPLAMAGLAVLFVAAAIIFAFGQRAETRVALAKTVMKR